MSERLEAHVLPRSGHPEASILAAALAEMGGDSVVGVIFFGSRKTNAHPDQFSAYDFFLITRPYADFYRRLRQAGQIRRHPWLMAALNRVLPPNAISLCRREGPARHAKCLVFSLQDFRRESSSSRRDHFAVARLFQATEILYARNDSIRIELLDAIARAHRCTYEWVRPWLPEEFDVATYTRTLLRVSLAAEIRPESKRRAADLWEAQQSYLCDVYGALLGELVEVGKLVGTGHETYRSAHPVGRWERFRTRSYFAWSRVRTTSRWAKHVMTFSDWVDYLRRKAERHSGQTIVLTRNERRLPLIFLWPRVLRHIRQKDR